jgi:catechol 2,3-dioxygenase-like lactoylglutathione lyase family enzyme
MKFHPVTPILRSFDEGKAREFYLDWLGFKVDFEHRFEPSLPLYMGISRGDCKLHISEHHGDGSPGAAIRILVDELEAFHAEVTAKKYKNYRPGLQDQEWGTREMVVQDGAGNRLIFYRELAPAEKSG